MPSRRSHTKSRKGCLECKRRHVKCDEGNPRCSLCKKRKLQCTYPPPSSDTDGQSSTPHELMDLTTGSTELPLPTRQLEIKLFHQYITETYATLPERQLNMEYFQKTLPNIAVNHPYLLDAIFALSALHIASLEPDEIDNRPWLEVALKYQTQACSAFSRVLTEITPQNCGPAFICSVFIMVCATAYPSASRGDHPFEPLYQVLEIRRLIAGCAFLYYQLTTNEHMEEISGWIPKEDETIELPDSPWTSKMVSLRSTLLGSLNQLRSKIENNPGPHQTEYIDTWGLLDDSIKRWPTGGKRGGIISWPIHISEAFIILLKDGDWMARILFLHYGVGMHLLSHKWFVKDWGRRLVTAVVQPLEDIPPEWTTTIAWVKDAVETDG